MVPETAQDMKDDFIEQVGHERLRDTLRQERNVELTVAVLSVRADEETRVGTMTWRTVIPKAN
jgi:hypothetical protein